MLVRRLTFRSMDEERWIYVACNCFRLGRTSPPPVAVAELTLDALGDVVLVDHPASPDSVGAMREWVQDRACPHPGMREYETILDVDWEYNHPLLAYYADVFKSSEYPALKSIVGANPATKVLMMPTIAGKVLDELKDLRSHSLPGTTTVLVDETGVRLWPFLEPDGLDAGRGFSPFYCRPDLGSYRDDLMQVGVDGSDVVIRSTSTLDEVLRSPAVEQYVGTDVIEVDDYILSAVMYRDPRTDGFVRGYAEPIRRYGEYFSHGPARIHSHARSVRVERVPLTLAGTLSFPRLLEAAAVACLDTSNPVAVAGTLR